MSQGEETAVSARPLVGDAKGEVLGDPLERASPQPRPGERRTAVALEVLEPHRAQLLDVIGVDLDDEASRRGHESTTAVQQAARVASDADVAVDEQNRLPATLGRQTVEDRPAQCEPAPDAPRRVIIG